MLLSAHLVLGFLTLVMAQDPGSGSGGGEDSTLALPTTVKILSLQTPRSGECHITEEEREATQFSARAQVSAILKDIAPDVVPCDSYSLGQVQHCPAASCQHLFEQSSEHPAVPGHYWIGGSPQTSSLMYCKMHTSCQCRQGFWTRVAYLNMSEPEHRCPAPQWLEVPQPIKACKRGNVSTPFRLSSVGCSSAIFSSNGVNYTHVCGSVLAYQLGSPDAFEFFVRNPDRSFLDTFYFDGVSVTHGSPRTHVWTFVAAKGEGYTERGICPCINTNSFIQPSVPDFVGEDYFCATGSRSTARAGELFTDDLLWDGEGCGNFNTCCEYRGGPYFCKELSVPTTDDIEVRICGYSDTSNEDTPVVLVDIYVL